MAKVLVVDDEAPIRALISKILVKDGHEVLEAENGQVACNLCSGANIDLIITDLVMPEKNGIEMIIEMKKNHPQLKVIAISGGVGFSGYFDLLSVARLLGAKHIIKKPFTVDDIRKAVNDMLA
jgi:two-component system response regulator (stage 0 sporulation protein F)